MLKNIAKVATKFVTNKELPLTLFNSRLFIRYSCQSDNSRLTYRQLIKHLETSHILQGGKTIRDALDKQAVRVETSEGMFFHILEDIPVVVNIYTRVIKDTTREVADIYIPANYADRWEAAIPKLFPHSTQPMHFQILHGGSEWKYDHDIVGGTSIGEFMVEFGDEKPLVEEHIYQHIDEVFDKFVNRPEEYRAMKRPRREVIMMYGPPGTGKTSICRHFIAKYRTHFIEYSPAMKSTYLIKLLEKLNGAPAVVLVEDIDSFLFLLTDIAARRHKNPNYQPPADGAVEKEPEYTRESQQDRRGYSEFINLLEGLVPLRNCIFIFTTNNPEKLRNSIYRMGRVNHHIEVNYPTIETIRTFLGFRKVDKRWKYIESLTDQRLPLDAIYRIKVAKNVDSIKHIIASRDLTLTLKDKASYE